MLVIPTINYIGQIRIFTNKYVVGKKWLVDSWLTEVF